MTKDKTGEWRSIIYAGAEDRNREYKASFPWNKDTDGATMAKVTKTILAMANLRDGGHIVIGVEEKGSEGRFLAVGMKPEHLVTYSYDRVADFVKEYAEPYVRFDLDIVEVDKKEFVVISVEGFDQVPVICKRSFSDILSEGRVYIRPRSGRPRSAPLNRYVDMRELLDLATERGIRDFLERLHRVSPVSKFDDAEKFKAELGDFG